MSKKIPEVFLTNGKKEICCSCKTNLEPHEKSFNMKGKHPQDTKNVKEMIFYCPQCNRFYVTQKLCQLLVKKHPGYHVDVATYTLKSKRTKSDNHRKIESDKKVTTTVSQNNSVLAKANNNMISDLAAGNAITYNAPLFVFSDENPNHNMCPKCNNSLSKEVVNIPVLHSNGDFHHYYAEAIKYCHACGKGYISSKNIISILKKASSMTQEFLTINVKNANIKRDKHDQSYYYYITLNNDDAICLPPQVSVPSLNKSNTEMNLSTKSFLAKMGYTVNKKDDVRHRILTNAVKQHGKRKVTDHISFLIRIREHQINGTIKYANAIRIWQRDLNYVASISK